MKSVNGWKRCSNKNCNNPNKNKKGLLKLENFYKNKAQSEGLEDYCKKCSYEKQQKRYEICPRISPPNGFKICANRECLNKEKNKQNFLPLFCFSKCSGASLGYKSYCKQCQSLLRYKKLGKEPKTKSPAGYRKCYNKSCANKNKTVLGFLKNSEFNKNRSNKDGLDDYCRGCSKIKNKEFRIKNISKCRQYNKKSYDRHKKKRKIANKRYKKNNPQKVEDIRLKVLYNITLNQYCDLLKKQKNVCAICFKRPKRNKKLLVDHNHITNKVRGLLCASCNTALGLLKTDLFGIINLKSAIKYIKEHS